MRIVDLFSGAGGLTFGFYYNLINGQFVRNRNNEFIFANEFDPHAANTFRLNFPDINMIEGNIQNINAEIITPLIGDEEVDVIIGGPPCQSYSTIGKRRWDDKARLYHEYLRILNIIRPKIFVFENVKGILSMHKDDNQSVMDDIRNRFENIEANFGYRLNIKVMDAVDYGVPQHRERVFIVGVRNDVMIRWQFPVPTHGDNGIPYITLEEAIGDLPAIGDGEHAERYIAAATNDYQRLMRNGSDSVSYHFAGQHNDKMKQVIASVPQGEGRPYINRLVEEGHLPKTCKLTSGYCNTYGRLYANRPSTTITNNMCTPSALRCIHYDQNRSLTPREGARIQSFPDWFQFDGAKVDITKQIGNAVPPLLAIALARRIEEILEDL